MIDTIIHSQVFIIALNIGAYILGALIIKSLKINFMNGLLPAIAIVIAAITMLDIDYAEYEQNSSLISFFLAPSVVSLGYVLHKHVESIKGNISSILISITVGAVVNILTINAILTIAGVDTSIIYSIQPKSVTTPIAISLSEAGDGITSLTVVAVVVTGVLGSIIGAPLLKLCRINNPISKGLAMGSSAHAIGTARAAELGAVEGAMGGLAIGIMGLITAIVLPLLQEVFV